MSKPDLLEQLDQIIEAYQEIIKAKQETIDALMKVIEAQTETIVALSTPQSISTYTPPYTTVNTSDPITIEGKP